MLVRICPNCKRELPPNQFKCKCGSRIGTNLPLVPSVAGIQAAKTETEKLAAQNDVLLQYHELELAVLKRISSNLGTITTIVVILVILAVIGWIMGGCAVLGL